MATLRIGDLTPSLQSSRAAALMPMQEKKEGLRSKTHDVAIDRIDVYNDHISFEATGRQVYPHYSALTTPALGNIIAVPVRLVFHVLAILESIVHFDAQQLQVTVIQILKDINFLAYSIVSCMMYAITYLEFIFNNAIIKCSGIIGAVASILEIVFQTYLIIKQCQFRDKFDFDQYFEGDLKTMSAAEAKSLLSSMVEKLEARLEKARGKLDDEDVKYLETKLGVAKSHLEASFDYTDERNEAALRTMTDRVQRVARRLHVIQNYKGLQDYIERPPQTLLQQLGLVRLRPESQTTRYRHSRVSGVARRTQTRVFSDLMTHYNSVLPNITVRSDRPDSASDAKVKEVMNTLQKVDVQTKKMILIHIVAISSLALFAAAFIVSLFFPPTAVLVIGLMSAAFTAGFVSSCLETGMIRSDGWTFDIRAFIPDIVRGCIGMEQLSKKRIDQLFLVMENKTSSPLNAK